MQQTGIARLLYGFEQILSSCGDLQGTARERFNEIQQELSQLSTKFSNNLLDATKAFKKLLKDPAEVCCCLLICPPQSLMER